MSKSVKMPETWLKVTFPSDTDVCVCGSALATPKYRFLELNLVVRGDAPGSVGEVIVLYVLGVYSLLLGNLLWSGIRNLNIVSSPAGDIFRFFMQGVLSFSQFDGGEDRLIDNMSCGVCWILSCVFFALLLELAVTCDPLHH